MFHLREELDGRGVGRRKLRQRVGPGGVRAPRTSLGEEIAVASLGRPRYPSCSRRAHTSSCPNWRFTRAIACTRSRVGGSSFAGTRHGYASAEPHGDGMAALVPDRSRGGPTDRAMNLATVLLVVATDATSALLSAASPARRSRGSVGSTSSALGISVGDPGSSVGSSRVETSAATVPAAARAPRPQPRDPVRGLRQRIMGATPAAEVAQRAVGSKRTKRIHPAGIATMPWASRYQGLLAAGAEEGHAQREGN